MGSLRTGENSFPFVQYTNVVRILKTLHRVYDGISFEILVEPLLLNNGSPYRYVFGEEVNVQNKHPRRANLHLNGSLQRRIRRAKKLQQHYNLLLWKSTYILNRIKRKFEGKNYKLSLIKRLKTQLKPNEPSNELYKDLPEIHLPQIIMPNVKATYRCRCCGLIKPAVLCSCNSDDDTDSDYETGSGTKEQKQSCKYGHSERELTYNRNRIEYTDNRNTDEELLRINEADLSEWL